MKKLSELSGDTLLVVYEGYSDNGKVITKDELESGIKDRDITKDGLFVYLAVENWAFLDMGDLQDWMERLEDQYDQYADWNDDMMSDLNQMKEAKAFIDTLNHLAHEHMSYSDGEGVDVWH